MTLSPLVEKVGLVKTTISTIMKVLKTPTPPSSTVRKRKELKEINQKLQEPQNPSHLLALSYIYAYMLHCSLRALPTIFGPANTIFQNGFRPISFERSASPA